MSPDLSKPEASALFETFGFGSIVLLSSLFFYRERITALLPVDKLLEFNVGGFGVLLITMTIFVSYIFGLAAIELGTVLSGKDKEVGRSASTIQATSVKEENQYLWDSYKEMHRKVRFSEGIAGTSAWITILLILSVFRVVQKDQSIGIWFWWFVSLTIAFLITAAARLKSRGHRLSFDLMLLKYEKMKNNV